MMLHMPRLSLTHQCVEGIARGALDGKLAPDEVGEVAVRLHPLGKFEHASHQLLVALQTTRKHGCIMRLIQTS